MTLLALVSSATALAGDEAKRSVAVLDLRPAGPDDVKLATLATAALTAGLAREHKGKVFGADDVRGLLDAQATQQLLGCEDEQCSIDASQALAVDEIITGRVGRLHGKVLVFISRIEPAKAQVRSRASRSFARGANLKREMGKVARALLSDEGERGGDLPLTDMRVALLFDEAGSNGPLRTRPVETCVGGQLLEVGVPLVSPQQVANIKKKTSPRSLLTGDVADSIDASDVDVMLVGVVDYGLYAEAMGVKNYEGQLSLQMIHVDTGQIIVSEQKVARSPGHSERMAVSAASKMLCKQVRPAIAAALERRVERGVRVVVEVNGSDAAAVEKLAMQLLKLKRVTRARLRRIKGKSAVVDVTLAGGDGLALALELRALQGAPDVREASAGKLVLAPL